LQNTNRHRQLLLSRVSDADFRVQPAIVFPIAHVDRGGDRNVRVDVKPLSDLERYLSHPRKKKLDIGTVAAIADALGARGRAMAAR